MGEREGNRVKKGDEETWAAPAQGCEHKANRVGSALSRKDQVGERLDTGREVMEGAGEVEKTL